MEELISYMTVEELYQWAKARNLEKKTSLLMTITANSIITFRQI